MKQTHTQEANKPVLMDLGLEDSGFQLVSDIEIPDIYYRRFRSGLKVVDELLGEGFLPGSAFTITAPAGCGKTTLMLQLLESLAMQGKRVGYASGEENKPQLAFTCKRLGVKNVQIATRTDVDHLVEDIRTKRLDILILDSFQCMRSRFVKTPKATEEYVINTIVNAAKKYECVVGMILHLTKGGKFKGGSLIPHAVDMNMELTRGDEEDYGTDTVRLLNVSKNRFGSTGEIELEMGSNGYNFETVISKPEGTPKSKKSSARADKINDLENIIKFATEHNGNIKLADAVELVGNFYRGKNLLTELTAMNKMRKLGRGDGAFWKVNS